MSIIDSSEVPFIIIIYASSIIGIIWACIQATAVSSIKVSEDGEGETEEMKQALSSRNVGVSPLY